MENSEQELYDNLLKEIEGCDDLKFNLALESEINKLQDKYPHPEWNVLRVALNDNFRKQVVKMLTNHLQHKVDIDIFNQKIDKLTDDITRIEKRLS